MSFAIDPIAIVPPLVTAAFTAFGKKSLEERIFQQQLLLRLSLTRLSPEPLPE